MKKLYGGLKLIHPNKTGFQPIIDMINSSNDNLSLLTYKSLKGFMITLDVSSNNSEYLCLNSNYRFENPVTSFILKFAVISPENDTDLPKYMNINKATESMISYYEEAKLQQTIWIKSIKGGRPEICPPVANFSLFDNQNSKYLCEFFQNKTKNQTKNIFDYLLDLMNKNIDYGLGVIIMPKVENSKTFAEIIYSQSPSISKSIQNNAYASVTAKIIRLFIEIGVIHFDLHAGNALIYAKPDNKIDSLIIDFGRASNIMNLNDDEYITANEKKNIIKIKNKYFNDFLNMNNSTNDNDKKTYINDVLNYIADLDYSKNQYIFNFTNSDKFQMDWIDKMPKERVLINAFNILKTSIATEGLKITPNTIKSYLSKGYIFDLNKDISSFMTNFPNTMKTNDCDDDISGMCNISGGKTHKKTKKNKILKKIKFKKTKRVYI